jgi:hypothetical protein
MVGSRIVQDRVFGLQETVQHSFGDSRQSRGECQSEPARRLEDDAFLWVATDAIPRQCSHPCY